MNNNGCVALGGDEMGETNQPPTETMKVAPRSIRKAGTSASVTVCPRCNAIWGGFKTAHCTACHETFTTVSTFDKHRTGSHPNSTRHCLRPADVGLVDAGRAYPCWAQAGSYEREDGQ